mmetsp:Transcript_27796/g.55581  ORF Transcript_27796/g.55581 Transcript_27796/m.55581 type:complete len:136 (-) Transcript_27796:106-513(-)
MSSAASTVVRKADAKPDASSRDAGQSGPASKGAATAIQRPRTRFDQGASADEEEDPLDSFMSSMQGELKEDLAATGTGMKRKYGETTAGVETSKQSGTFDDRMKEWNNTKGMHAHQLRKAYNKKRNAMREGQLDG